MSPAINSSSPESPTATTTPTYYEKGSVELAVETPVMMKRLEKRRTLTGGSKDAERLLIVLVGLPARGKSFIARKLLNYLVWRGNQCRIFNVGKYRRQQQVNDEQDDDNNLNNNSKQDANFFDDTNATAAKLRQEAAEMALKETLQWLEGSAGLPLISDLQDCSNVSFSFRTNSGASSAAEDDSSTSTGNSYYENAIPGHISHSQRRQFHRIAIFDATNSTKERRQWILQECAKADKVYQKRTGVLFLESICDDQELLQENFKVKISSCPDFDGMTEEAALMDLQSRIAKYEARYETMDDHRQSFIKIFNLSSRLMVNHIYGRLAKVVLPAIMAWNTGSRPIFLCRAGETEAMQTYMQQQQQQNEQRQQQLDKFESLVDNRIHRKRSDRLGERGRCFRDALCGFVEQEGMAFMKRQNENAATKTRINIPGKMDTGTSISGLYEEEDHPFEHQSCVSDQNDADLPFPCLVMSSTMPRAVETATWKPHRFPVKDVSNLNPLDMGDFTGMDLASIRQQHPEWYEQLKRDPFHTRFPGGESYSDLIDRCHSILIDVEQQLGLTVVISHVSILQVLVSYFRSTPIHECMDIEIPMHTAMKFVPLRGGGWHESQHALLPDGDVLEQTTNTEGGPLGDEPIWGDSRSCLPRRLSSTNDLNSSE
ncbi:phosphofructo-2-kinase/fructose-2,6-bisphosphatase [Seminavis robusta]|uniref:Phosphofructo-2-kinase/fructose-2,6-bisphosphatas e n=1 Tax=Seminavis robusta TaxID=568900 RepID=A0A9N8HH34_9STRA|nr:phosphofructo-2-kinase/fructose-2,6-bisphosphatase [Seminavis robusta]|eukprot:Sro678_g186020.1 phosphofructo-2-kinase/fructose-2,6-bisphosphatase (656) ;mRNA; r:48462-50429